MEKNRSPRNSEMHEAQTPTEMMRDLYANIEGMKNGEELTLKVKKTGGTYVSWAVASDNPEHELAGPASREKNVVIASEQEALFMRKLKESIESGTAKDLMEVLEMFTKLVGK